MVRFLAIALLVVGCAKGSVDDEGSDRIGTDGGRRDLGGDPDRDLGGGGRDMFVETCDDDSYPEECSAAEDLGDVMIGAEPLVITGVLPQLSDEDWFAVRFPPNAMGAGGGNISIELAGDETTVMTLEGPTCGPRTACGEGTAGAITSYSFVDDADMSVEFPYSTRDTPWPEAIFVRIHRSGGPVTCTEYSLTIRR